jgi:FAD/FMN-containing dehydrogenase
VAAGEQGWDEARRCWNLAVDQRPAAVVFPESADEVADVVAFAAANGFGIAFQGGGHNTGPLSWSEPVILLRTERMRGIAIDPSRRRARVEAGVLSDELTNAAAAHALAYLAGTSPDVGVVGYALGGGLSWLLRRHGLAANSILAAELVLADGRRVRADSTHEPDLFWAIRGGGGSFGAVTALELALYPVAEMYAGALFWPIERAAEILDAWRDWTQAVPDECTSLGRLLRLPPVPELPDHLRGRSFALVELAVLGDEGPGAELVEPLRRLGPELDTVATTPVPSLSAINMDPPGPVPYCGDGLLLEALDAETVDAVVAVFGDSSLMHFEVRHLGGASAIPSPGHGALDAIDSPYASFAFGLAPDGEARATVADEVEKLHAALATCHRGRRYLNLTESPVDARAMFPARSYERLCTLKSRYDPRGLFRANHPIAPLPPV